MSYCRNGSYSGRPRINPPWEKTMSKIKLPRSVFVAKEVFLHEMRNLTGAEHTRVSSCDPEVRMSSGAEFQIMHCEIESGSIQPMQTSDTRPALEALTIPEYTPDCLVRYVHIQGCIDDLYGLLDPMTKFWVECYVYSKSPAKHNSPLPYSPRAWYPYTLTFSLESYSGENKHVHYYLDGLLAGKCIKQNTIIPLSTTLNPAWSRDRQGAVYVPLSVKLGTQTNKPNS